MCHKKRRLALVLNIHLIWRVRELIALCSKVSDVSSLKKNPQVMKLQGYIRGEVSKSHPRHALKVLMEIAIISPGTSLLRRLLPNTPHPNQTADRTRKTDYAIIKIYISKSCAWYCEIAKIRNELYIRCSPLSAISVSSSVHLLRGPTYRSIFLLSTTASPSFLSNLRSRCPSCHRVYNPAMALKVSPVNQARYASFCNRFALAEGRIPAESSCS